MKFPQVLQCKMFDQSLIDLSTISWWIHCLFDNLCTSTIIIIVGNFCQGIFLSPVHVACDEYGQ